MSIYVSSRFEKKQQLNCRTVLQTVYCIFFSWSSNQYTLFFIVTQLCQNKNTFRHHFIEYNMIWLEILGSNAKLWNFTWASEAIIFSAEINYVVSTVQYLSTIFAVLVSGYFHFKLLYTYNAYTKWRVFF